MELTEIYEKGEQWIRQKDFGISLNGVETGFIPPHDRLVLDRYTFQQRCIDAGEASTTCNALGVHLSTPVIMSSITMPIPAIMDNGLMETAGGLKDAGSLMWTGTPIPKNLQALVETGIPMAANVKPYQDRDKIYQEIDEIQGAGVHWVGIEVDAGQGTKVGDRPMATGCNPLSLKELRDIRKRVSGPLILKGILSHWDAMKALDAGADGIVVTNHGAHTIDYLPHPLQVMDDIVSAVQGKMTIIVECGFRRGSDVLKGLAFGADLVGIGRPVLYGLAAAGREGVRDVVNGISGELKRIMSMVGADQPGEIRRDVLIED